jgi:hypothetical protein
VLTSAVASLEAAAPLCYIDTTLAVLIRQAKGRCLFYI